MRLPAGHWPGERAATGILVLARKGRAFGSLDTLIARQGGKHVLYGSALTAAAQTWVADSDTPVRRSPRHPRSVYHCDSYNNLDQAGTALSLPVIIDITSTWETKLSALNAHATQPIASHFGPMAETLARLHGARIGVTHAEAFRPVPVLGRLPAAVSL